eukprot:10322921-Prorocentrum_lima.AAC.1
MAQGPRVVDVNVLHVREVQLRRLLHRVHQRVERRATRPGENDGVDEIRRAPVVLIPRLRS